MRLEFKTAVRDMEYRSEIIQFLHSQPTVREPVTRPTKDWTCSTLRNFFHNNKVYIESALLQIVGTLAPMPCISCLQKYGPWARCVVFHVADSPIESCANCHWGGKGERCEFWSEDQKNTQPTQEIQRDHSRPDPARAINHEYAARIRALHQIINSILNDATMIRNEFLDEDSAKRNVVNEILQGGIYGWDATYQRLLQAWPNGIPPSPTIFKLQDLRNRLQDLSRKMEYTNKKFSD